MKIKFLFHGLLVIGMAFSCKSSQQDKEDEYNSNVMKTVKYPEKGDMLLLTDRPPQLETPLKILRQDFTPNEYFFVRWHLAMIPKVIDAEAFRLEITGPSVNKTISLSLNDLKTKFTPYSIVALAECAGNSRSFFKPRVAGGQWCNGAMGNAKWTGVKVKDILEMAGIKDNAVDVAFDGLDEAPLPSVPDFVKSLGIKHAMDGEVMIAYQMNGKDIPMLNGYPLKLVVPGWFATYWVGALHKIEVLDHPFDGFWMKKAYTIADNPQYNENPKDLAKKTVPVTTLALHSIFVEPEPDTKMAVGKPYDMEGLAFDGGKGITKVDISLDNGSTWTHATLDPELGKYAWRRWRYTWTPAKAGKYTLKVKATNAAGETQAAEQWNRSGYARNVIEQMDVTVN